MHNPAQVLPGLMATMRLVKAGHPASSAIGTLHRFPSFPQRPILALEFRCGSKKHRLNACKALEDPKNPLPFAACFICSGKGHIAAACPRNPNGVYPNGGCCRLCGQKDHLVKVCRLRKDSTGKCSFSLSPKTAALTPGDLCIDGTSGELALEPDVIANFKETGPDEDDFHTLKRRRREVELEEELQEREDTAAKVAEKAAQSNPGIQKPRPSTKKSKVVKF